MKRRGLYYKDQIPVVQRADNFIHWMSLSSRKKLCKNFPIALQFVNRVEAIVNLSMELCEKLPKTVGWSKFASLDSDLSTG